MSIVRCLVVRFAKPVTTLLAIAFMAVAVGRFSRLRTYVRMVLCVVSRVGAILCSLVPRL